MYVCVGCFYRLPSYRLSDALLVLVKPLTLTLRFPSSSCSRLAPPSLLLPPPPSSSLQADVEAFSKLPGVDAITVVMDGRMDLCDEYDAYGMGNRSRFPCDGAPDIRGMNDATLLDTAKQIASAVCRHASVSGYVSQLRRSCLFQVSASNSNRYLFKGDGMRFKCQSIVQSAPSTVHACSSSRSNLYVCTLLEHLY